MSEVRFRPGLVINPYTRLDGTTLENLHKASMKILDNPGIVCFNEEAVSIYTANGCRANRSERDNAWVVRIPESVVNKALESVPSKVVLGARNPENALQLDADVPRIYFGTGSETNIFLESTLETFRGVKDSSLEIKHPVFTQQRGTVRRLCDSARLCNALPSVDFFIRNVNVQDEGIEPENKDVNVFFASLMYMTKHIQAGLTSIDALDSVLKMAALAAGGEEALRKNPLFSFIACLVKSPLQMVEDTTQKVIEIARRGFPLVISSSPQGGSTAPIQEEGMVSLINAEILAGVTLTQLVNPGTPVLYGAVPVRARLDTLHDLYGAPEFVHYNSDCVQMARRYRIPCYSTAGVADGREPGMQSAVEKLLTHLSVAFSGAQYIHYAFGLLDRTNIFCPLQAVLDDAAIDLVKNVLRPPRFGVGDIDKAVDEVRKVMVSGTRLFARHIRKHLRRGVVSDVYQLSSDCGNDRVFEKATEKLDSIRANSGERLDDGVIRQIYDTIPGLLPNIGI